MAVKIFIKRKVAENNILELTNLLKRIRSFTLDQDGYIYGETLRRIDKPGEIMVISTWKTFEDWDAWFKNEKRMSLQSEIDMLLGQETQYAIYEE